MPWGWREDLVHQIHAFILVSSSTDKDDINIYYIFHALSLSEMEARQIDIVVLPRFTFLCQKFVTGLSSRRKHDLKPKCHREGNIPQEMTGVTRKAFH